VQKKKTAVLNDKVESLGTLSRMPVDPVVAILQRIACGTPCQRGDPFVVRNDNLPQEMLNGPGRTQVVEFTHQRIKGKRPNAPLDGRIQS